MKGTSYEIPHCEENKNIQIKGKSVGLGGLGVTCSPRDPRLAGSNPVEVDGFFQDVKLLSTSPPGGTLSWESLQARYRT